MAQNVIDNFINLTAPEPIGPPATTQTAAPAESSFGEHLRRAERVEVPAAPAADRTSPPEEPAPADQSDAIEPDAGESTADENAAGRAEVSQTDTDPAGNRADAEAESDQQDQPEDQLQLSGNLVVATDQLVEQTAAATRSTGAGEAVQEQEAERTEAATAAAGREADKGQADAEPFDRQAVGQLSEQARDEPDGRQPEVELPAAGPDGESLPAAGPDGAEPAPDADLERQARPTAAARRRGDRSAPPAGPTGQVESAQAVATNGDPKGNAAAADAAVADAGSRSAAESKAAATANLAPVAQTAESGARDGLVVRGPSEARSADRLPPVDRVRFVQRVAQAFQVARGGRGEIQLRLNPPHLGRLRLGVTVENGVLSARLETETPAARAALLDNLPALQQRLAQHQIQVDRFDVDLMQQPATGSGDQPAGDAQADREQRAPQRNGSVASEVDTEAAAGGAAAAIDPVAGKLNVVI